MISKIKEGGVTAALGFTASSALGDIKGKGRTRPDVGLLVSDVPCVCVALFTRNIVKAAPVVYDANILAKRGRVRAIVANAGNANACTGRVGLDDCLQVAGSVSDVLGIHRDSVLVASTGVIGVRLPYERIVRVMPELAEGLSDDGGLDFAEAIMTTDTFSKESAVMVETASGSYVVGGCCKGSGMIAPSVATMLSFITTDADISADMLDKCLRLVSGDTFNCVTVDGDMSTNDTVFALANGMSGVKIGVSEYDEFVAGLRVVCDELARMMARDGEGATKLVTIMVKGAKTDGQARLCASKIANSPLVKTMFAGSDPNWGRLLASAGASGAEFDPECVDIYFDSLHYVKDGMIIDVSFEKDACAIMKRSEYDITVDLGAGECKAKFYTCDFTADYVKINADYRS